MNFGNIDTHIVDVIFLIVITMSMLLAYYRGFLREIFSTGNWIISGWLSFKYYLYIKPLFLKYLSSEILAEILAFVVLFVFLLTIGTLINQFINSKIKNSPLASLDKALGLFFGLIRALVVISIIFLISVATVWKNKSIPTWLTKTYCFPIIKESSDFLTMIFPYSSSLMDSNNLKLNEMDKKNTGKILERLIEPPIINNLIDDGYNASEREAMDRLHNLETTEDNSIENTND